MHNCFRPLSASIFLISLYLDIIQCREARFYYHLRCLPSHEGGGGLVWVADAKSASKHYSLLEQIRLTKDIGCKVVL